MVVKTVATLHCDGEPSCARFMPAGNLLAVGDMSDKLTLWDTATWKVARRVNIGDFVRAVAFSRQNHVMALGTAWDHKLQTWDTQAWKLRSTFTGYPQEITTVSADDAGRFVASCGGFNDKFLVRDVRKNRTVFSYPLNDEMIECVALSPDGTMLAAAVGKKVLVWETRQWKLLHKIPSSGKEYFHAVAFSSDSKLLACSGGYERSLFILTECGSWKTRFSLRGDYGFMEYLCFSPQNKLLASVSASHKKGVIRLWDTTKGALVQMIPRLDKSHTDLSFHPTENLLASACNDGTVSIFRLSST